MKEGYRAIVKRVSEKSDAAPGAGYDTLFIARNAIVEKKCADVTREMTASLKKGKLIR
jgi:hypothetical protein